MECCERALSMQGMHLAAHGSLTGSALACALGAVPIDMYQSAGQCHAAES